MLQIHQRLIVLTKTNGRCEFIFLPEVLCPGNVIHHVISCDFDINTLRHDFTLRIVNLTTK